MQCVPWPWPSCGFAPLTNDFATMVREGKSGCFRSKPVSRTATLIPLPEKAEAGTPVACRPHVAVRSEPDGAAALARGSKGAV